MPNIFYADCLLGNKSSYATFSGPKCCISRELFLRFPLQLKTANLQPTTGKCFVCVHSKCDPTKDWLWMVENANNCNDKTKLTTWARTTGRGMLLQDGQIDGYMYRCLEMDDGTQNATGFEHNSGRYWQWGRKIYKNLLKSFMGLGSFTETDKTDSLGEGSKTMARTCWQKLHTHKMLRDGDSSQRLWGFVRDNGHVTVAMSLGDALPRAFK